MDNDNKILMEAKTAVEVHVSVQADVKGEEGKIPCADSSLRMKEISDFKLIGKGEKYDPR